MRAEGVCGDDTDHFLGVGVGDGSTARCNAGIAHQDVDATEVRNHSGHQGRTIGRIVDGALVRPCAPACSLDGRNRLGGGACVLAVIDRHRGAVRTQQFTDAAPDSTATTGDDGNSTGKFVVVPHRASLTRTSVTLTIEGNGTRLGLAGRCLGRVASVHETSRKTAA